MTTTKPRRLLCRPWEVRAYLSGAKTRFRVPIKPQPGPETGGMWYCVSSTERSSVGRWTPRQIGKDYKPGENNPQTGESVKCPFGTVGSRLWLAETWFHGDAFFPDTEDFAWKNCRVEGKGRTWVDYRATATDEQMWEFYDNGERWKPAATMPQWASRLMLEVKSVRVQRLQDISEEDAIAEGVAMLATLKKSGFKVGAFFGVEGVTDTDWLDPRDAYEQLWDSTHGPGSWESNPWVWSVSVVKVKP